MRIEELENPPQWLLDAYTEDADVEIIDGIVHWYGGFWEYGVWQGGTWYDGYWRNGIWHDGVWFGGIWHSGTWKDGTWHRGIWHGGKWINGYKTKLVQSDTSPVNN